MKDPSPYKCDYCDNRKGAANHWFLLYAAGVGAFHLVGWNSEDPDKRSVEHICSEQCAHKALAKYLGKLSSPDPKPKDTPCQTP